MIQHILHISPSIIEQFLIVTNFFFPNQLSHYHLTGNLSASIKIKRKNNLEIKTHQHLINGLKTIFFKKN